MEIILASQSPRRKKLLNMLDIRFRVISSGIDESTYQFSRKSPSEYTEQLAEIKAVDVSDKYPDALVIGGDTIVVLDGQIIEKPESISQAVNILETLSGNTHQVYTGISIQYKTRNIHHSFSDKTDVTFKKLNEGEIIYYINNYEPFDKAGSYGIQDWSAMFVPRINGCFYNVVGFPVSKFCSELKKIGIDKEIFEKHLNTKKETP